MAKNKKAEIVSKQEQKYDPAKTYRWEKDTEFRFNGVEFSILYNNLSGFMGADSINVQQILKLVDSFTVVQTRLMEMVNEGLIGELKEGEQIETA